MTLNHSKSKDEEHSPSVRLSVIENYNNAITLSPKIWGSNFFHPQIRQLIPNESIPRSLNVPAPENAITLFTLRLAILEKSASGLGTLGFIWATVVLLGGFADNLIPTDSWFVTVILLIEGARIFSRSHELEWQPQVTSWSLHQFSLKTDKFVLHPLLVTGRNPQNSELLALSYSTQRMWPFSEVPILPYVGWAFSPKNFSRFFKFLQLASAVACVIMSLTRLIQHDYGQSSENTRNRTSTLDIFYALALAEGMTILIEKVYWNWKKNYCKLLEKVQRECKLNGPKGMASVKRFFYDSYSKCINGSIFDGLKMDLVSFGCELLDSNSREEQLMGADILDKFSGNKELSSYTLRRIGCSTTVIERLIEMLNWKNLEEQEIRKSAADIVCRLASKKHSAIRVATVTGAMESISSLLYTERNASVFSSFNLLGLMILKKLARDHDNCYKIGNARGVMPQIVNFTACNENLLRNNHAPDLQIMIIKRALQLVKILVSTTGQTGKTLRKEISDIVFTVSNIREILVYGESHMVLQKLAIEVLTSLAMDEDAREKIGCTGGVVRSLLSIYFRPFLTEEQSSVSAEAGEALGMIAMENASNCNKIMMEKDAVENLIGSLHDPVLRVTSSRILMSLCAYSAPQRRFRLVQVASAVPTVLKAMLLKNGKLVEISIGLARQLLRFLNPEEYAEKMEEAGINDAEVSTRLVEILKEYSKPDIRVPRIRRFAVELMIWLMEFRNDYRQLFKNLGADEVLRGVDENTSELESFNVFSGSVGIGRSNVTVSSLVDIAIDLMA